MSDTRLFETPPGVRLIDLAALPAGAARGFVLQMRAGRFHGFVVRTAQGVQGYVDRCPHAGLPLVRTLDAYLTPDGTLIQCAWHAALFRIEDGLCVGGPCTGQRLTPWPVRIAGDAVLTA
ncbi:Rieske (2Fe-2S) protein [Sphingomonas morindae]|uniref:Rieske (2Fe-2S) protein n=1 Tax=Sphingomonas morindae TaxID=1541170 RepID=A0ABY4X5D9_9SPHN|nr:Rieske (2Fe-2S) protein [Sphingomonas morindae]USI72091.1 Rieske (2Fe-2S) protein [Sphingomonas morindae]